MPNGLAKSKPAFDFMLKGSTPTRVHYFAYFTVTKIMGLCKNEVVPSTAFKWTLLRNEQFLWAVRWTHEDGVTSSHLPQLPLITPTSLHLPQSTSFTTHPSLLLLHPTSHITQPPSPNLPHPTFLTPTPSQNLIHPTSFTQAHMARGIHRLPKVSPGPAMP